MIDQAYASAVKEITELKARLSIVEAQRDLAVGALASYANEDQWVSVQPGGELTVWCGSGSGYEVAKEALADQVLAALPSPVDYKGLLDQAMTILQRYTNEWDGGVAEAIPKNLNVIAPVVAAGHLA